MLGVLLPCRYMHAGMGVVHSQGAAAHRRPSFTASRRRSIATAGSSQPVLMCGTRKHTLQPLKAERNAGGIWSWRCTWIGSFSQHEGVSAFGNHGLCSGDRLSLTWCLVKPKAKAHGHGFILHRRFRAASLTCRLTHTPTRRSTSAPASPFLKIVRMASTTRFKSSAGFVLQVFDRYLGRDLFSRAASLGELGRALGPSPRRITGAWPGILRVFAQACVLVPENSKTL